MSVDGKILRNGFEMKLGKKKRTMKTLIKKGSTLRRDSSKTRTKKNRRKRSKKIEKQKEEEERKKERQEKLTWDGAKGLKEEEANKKVDYEATQKVKKDVKQVATSKTNNHTDKSTVTPLPLGFLVLILERNNPDKRSVPEEEVMDLGDYYFSKVQQVVIKITPRKRKVDESSKEIIFIEEPKAVWKITNFTKKKISHNTTDLLSTFGDANRTTIQNRMEECG